MFRVATILLRRDGRYNRLSGVAYVGGVPAELFFDQLKAVILEGRRPSGGARARIAKSNGLKEVLGGAGGRRCCTPLCLQPVREIGCYVEDFF